MRTRRIAATVSLAALLVHAPAHAVVSSIASGSTLTITSDNLPDTIAVACSGGNVTVNAAPPSSGPAACASITLITVTGNGGDDVVDLAGVTAAAFPPGLVTQTSGGLGADTVIGTGFADATVGGDGNDVVLMGAGDDTFTWNPGDDNDTLEGQDGADALLFNGANVVENITIFANGGRVTFFRDIASVTMDLNDVERIAFAALGGADNIVVGNLAGTDLAGVDLDLSAGGVGDTFADIVTANGTPGVDALAADAAGGAVRLTVPPVVVSVTGAEAVDQLRVNALGGADTLVATTATVPGAPIVAIDGGSDVDAFVVAGTAAADTLLLTSAPLDPAVPAGTQAVALLASSTNVLRAAGFESTRVDLLDGGDSFASVGNVAALTVVTVDGGEGDDTILGGNGADTLIGGNGADLVDGNQAIDLVALGAGNDTFVWDPGDGSDTVEGGPDFDRMRFNGSAGAEIMELQPNGSRFRLTRNLGSIVMDVDDVERVDVFAFAAADVVNVADIAATDVVDVRIDAGPENDTVSTRLFAGIQQRLDGGAPAIFPGDTLNVAGFAGDLRQSPLAAPGFALLSHTNFEFGPAGSGGRVTGVAYADADLDGSRDAGEAGLAGARVFDDVDGDGTFDAVEPSVLTGADGSYELVFGSDQTVDIGVVAPAGAISRSGTTTVVLAGGTTVAGIDFALLQGTVFEAILVGWQETPPNASTATGTGLVLLNPAQDSIAVSFDFTGLGSANTLSHIHAAAPRGAAAAPLFDLPVSNATSGSFEAGPFAVTPAQVAQLRAGLWYFNVHSANFPGGEIRGQIDNALFLDGFE